MIRAAREVASSKRKGSSYLLGDVIVVRGEVEALYDHAIDKDLEA